jgi:hypothetical protein
MQMTLNIERENVVMFASGIDRGLNAVRGGLQDENVSQISTVKADCLPIGAADDHFESLEYGFKNE